MILSLKNRSKKIGMPPGTLVHIGEKREAPVKITRISYDQTSVTKNKYDDISVCIEDIDKNQVNWINIDGIHDMNIISTIGKAFDIHPLLLEDIVNSDQRPKFESFDNFIFVVCRMIFISENKKDIKTEQISLVITENTVISFQEEPGDVFDAVRDRIKNKVGKIRGMNSGYLAYSLIDSVTDHYFLAIEQLGYEIDSLEDRLMEGTDDETVKTIHRLRSQVIMMRKSIWPLREIILGLEKDETDILGEQTTRYFRDVYDHTIQIMDAVEIFRDLLTGMMDLYLSGVSNRMNQVMKVLTIISTIFIPMTFIAGVYGMNFKNMPELGWNFGYYIALLLMLGVFVFMFVFFKRKKWF